MSIDFAKLVSQGRAKSMGVPWSAEELDALLALERERGIGRQFAADYIRNGIVTLEDYDAAQAVKFVPKTIEVAATDASKVLADAGQAAIASKKSKKGKAVDPVDPVAPPA